MKAALAMVVGGLCLGLSPGLPVVDLSFASGRAGQTRAVAPSSEIAETFLKAKTVAIIGITGKQMKDRLWANPQGERGRVKVESVLTAWGRYEIVVDPREADLVLVVTELQKNINVFKLANLVAELKVYRGGQEPAPDAIPLWSDNAAEGFSKLPATKVAEKFRDYVITLTKGGTTAPQ